MNYFKKIVRNKPDDMKKEISRNNLKTAQLSPRQMSTTNLKTLGPKEKLMISGIDPYKI